MSIYWETSRCATRAIVATILLAAGALPGSAAELPVDGISHVTFRVTDLDKAKAFYTGILGFSECFDLKRRDGRLFLVVLKVNDQQFIEILPNLKAGENERMIHVALVTSDVESLHRDLVSRGLSPDALRPAGGDATRAVELMNPEGNKLEFTQYLPDSYQAKARGKCLNQSKVSDHILRAGIVVPRNQLEQALAFYRDQLGFTAVRAKRQRSAEASEIDLDIPGKRGDQIALMLNHQNPSREQLGFMQHITLEVEDLRKIFRRLEARDAAEKQAVKPHRDRNGDWALDLYDPDGSRIELVQARR